MVELIFLQIDLRFTAFAKRDSLRLRDEQERFVMKPRARFETGAHDMFRSRLDQIINMKHELVKLTAAISWAHIETACATLYKDGPGMPPKAIQYGSRSAILCRRG